MSVHLFFFLSRWDVPKPGRAFFSHTEAILWIRPSPFRRAGPCPGWMSATPSLNVPSSLFSRFCLIDGDFPPYDVFSHGQKTPLPEIYQFFFFTRLGVPAGFRSGVQSFFPLSRHSLTAPPPLVVSVGPFPRSGSHVLGGTLAPFLERRMPSFQSCSPFFPPLALPRSLFS